LSLDVLSIFFLSSSFPITPVAGKSNTHIDNSTDFTQQVREIKIEEWGQMVSFDVFHQFTMQRPKKRSHARVTGNVRV
jgi:hypothetical protein